MKALKLIFPMMLLFASLISCTGKDASYSDEHDVTVSPEALECDSKASSLVFEVKADASWQAYVADDCKDWILDVSPQWSKEPVGTVTVKVAENLERKSRSGSVVIKCGTTRKNVIITQAADIPEQSDIKCPLEGYTLVWHDEFEDASVNSANWTFENWKKGHVNNELQYYVSGGRLGNQETVFIEDGALCIKAQKADGSAKFGTEDIKGQVISGRMNSKKAWKYGYMEARILLPKGKGTWPAFWCMPKDMSEGWPKCGEIDIMEEVGADANEVSSSIHTGSYNHTIGTQKTAKRMLKDAEGAFHLYALEWTEDYLKTYVDGKLLFTFNNDKTGNNNTWPFDKEFYIILNLAWGGAWGGYKGVDESALPCTMKVDYVRVFQK